MPTPVPTARQCLTEEAAAALDEAVSVARRRSHPQTTSLHALFALLHLPSSSALSDACSRARNAAYSPRLQLRALDLCFSAALDRLPSSSSSSSTAADAADKHPPISNSLMAAIKRSQANQRRHPDAFHFFHHHHHPHPHPHPHPPPPSSSAAPSATSPTSISCVKVELQQLILSILDDPVVSRVFGEAGFRSCDVKLAIVRPPVMRFQRPRRPPLFLCNFDEADGVFGSSSSSRRRSFSFPFAATAAGDDNWRRIGEVMGRSKGKNPLLVGEFAGEAARGFAASVLDTAGVLPGDLIGNLRFVSLESEVAEFVGSGSGSEVLLRSRIDDLHRMLETCGVLLSFGDLKVLLVGSNGGAVMDRVSFVVSQFTKLLDQNRAKFWLIGATANYETYLNFLNSFPSIEKDWDLQLLPITSSLTSPSSVNGGLPSRPPSSEVVTATGEVSNTNFHSRRHSFVRHLRASIPDLLRATSSPCAHSPSSGAFSSFKHQTVVEEARSSLMMSRSALVAVGGGGGGDGRASSMVSSLVAEDRRESETGEGVPLSWRAGESTIILLGGGAEKRNLDLHPSVNFEGQECMKKRNPAKVTLHKAAGVEVGARDLVDGGGDDFKASIRGGVVPSMVSPERDGVEPFSSSGPYQSVSRCRACNDKYEQEVSTIVSGGCSRSVADQFQESVPSWLQMAEVNANSNLNIAKAKDDGTTLNAKIAGLQRKWSDICRRLNHRPSVSISEAGCYQVRPPMFHGTTGFPFAVKVDNHISSSVNAVVKGTACESVFPIMSTGLQKFPLMEKGIPKPVVSKARSDNSASELEGRLSKSEGLQLQSYQLPECSTSRLSNPSHNMSPSSPVSVATDLGLGTIYAPSSTEELNKPSFQAHKERLMDISGCLPSKVDMLNSNILNPSIRSSSGCSPDLNSQVELKDFKALNKCLVEKVGRQDEVIHVISQIIARCRTGNDERRRRSSTRQDIWFSFVGPDRIAKKKIAVALAEIIFGGRHNLICVDLSPHDGSTHSNTVLDCHEISSYDVRYRGKTVVDIIADEIIKKPPSVVFLENIDKADLLAQRSLSQAITTGKFQDTHGREISIHNSIFLTTVRVLKDNKENASFEKDLAKFKEERISEARRMEMQILIDCIPEVKFMGDSSSKVRVASRKGSFELNKRKRSGIGDLEGHDEKLESMKPPLKTSKCLDLNLPIEEMEQECSDSKSSDSECISENSKLWLEDLVDQMDGTLLFKPFDFDALANNILKEISSVLTSTVRSEVLLEIDYEVMEQLLAAAWISNGISAIKDWLERILGGCLTEAQKRHSLNSSRTLLKLQSCEGKYVKDLAPGVCLPARIPLN
ncbi:hypothetical protein Sjap_000977 [Stephania japonica]|uniref:Clp R domain-containing protein n=1 Tax=Stephania japonica TaxID=461633 RepID=A0AAP0KLE4_9MAGN